MQALRDVMGRLQSEGAVVFGVSADSVEAQKAFWQKEHLNFPLLSDTDKKTIEAYGVLSPRGYADRVTFVIGWDGRIRQIDKAVNGQFVFVDGKLAGSRHGENLALALSNWHVKLGQPVPNFSLPAYDGTTASLYQPGKKATVVIFMSKNCPVSQSYDERMAQLANDPAYKDVAFLGINSNTDETIAEVRDHAKARGIPFPVAKDPLAAIAVRFGAQATPTACVIDSKGIAVYRGAIDDDQNASQVKEHYLKDALDATLAGKPVARAETKVFGCKIKR